MGCRKCCFVDILVALLLSPLLLLYLLLSLLFAVCASVSSCCSGAKSFQGGASDLEGVPISHGFLTSFQLCLRAFTGSSCVLQYLACTGSPAAATIIFLKQRFDADPETEGAKAHVVVVGGEKQMSASLPMVNGEQEMDSGGTLVDTTVVLCSLDSVEAALRELALFPGQVAIHDAANRAQVGGSGMLPLGGSQEEALIRRSNLFWLMNPSTNPAFHLQLAAQQPDGVDHHIPYFGAVYVPNVTFLCPGGPDKRLNVVATAGVDLRTKSDEWRFFFQRASADDVRHVTLVKLDALLTAAARFGNRSIVLAAQGCGVFARNRELSSKGIVVAEIVAECFAELLKGSFKGRFDRVVFAIYCPPGETNTLLQVFEGALHKANLNVVNESGNAISEGEKNFTHKV